MPGPRVRNWVTEEDAGYVDDNGNTQPSSSIVDRALPVIDEQRKLGRRAPGGGASRSNDRYEYPVHGSLRRYNTKP